MTEEQYEYLKKLIENNRIDDTRKKLGENETLYTFITKQNSQKTRNKYIINIKNYDLDSIKKLDRLVVQQRVMKKQNKIKKLQIAVGAIAIVATISGIASCSNKQADYYLSVQDEATHNLEQIKEEHPNATITNEMMEKEYSMVHKERMKKLEDIDKEIERLKKEKEELTKSYYEPYNENARSK